jgi:HEAT repeat protein
MDSRDVTGVDALFDDVQRAAPVDPVLQSDEYWKCVRAVHARSDATVFRRAVSLCSDSDPVQRAVGADVLAQLGMSPDGGNYPFADESAPVLLSLLEDSDTRVIASALYALGHLKRGKPTDLASLKDHSSEDVRAALAYALGGRDDDLSCGALIVLAADLDLDTRNWATFALGTLSERDSPSIREALMARLSDDDDEVRGEAMLGLAKRQDARATQVILKELSRREVTNFAIEAAAEMPLSVFRSELEELLAAHPSNTSIQRAVDRCRIADAT